MADLPTFGEIRSSIQFKYYGTAGSPPYLRASYKSLSSDYEHSIIIILTDDFSRLIDEKIQESLLAMQAYAIEHPEVDKPAEVIHAQPRHPAGDKIPDDSSMVISPKTPKQLEKEEEEQIDKLGSE